MTANPSYIRLQVQVRQSCELSLTAKRFSDLSSIRKSTLRLPDNARINLERKGFDIFPPDTVYNAACIYIYTYTLVP